MEASKVTFRCRKSTSALVLWLECLDYLFEIKVKQMTAKAKLQYNSTRPNGKQMTPFGWSHRQDSENMLRKRQQGIANQF